MSAPAEDAGIHGVDPGRDAMTGMRDKDQERRQGNEVRGGPARSTIIALVVGVIVVVAVVLLLIMWLGGGGSGSGGIY